MQGMGYAKGPSGLSALELKASEKIFDDSLTVFNIEALDMLCANGGKASSRQPRKRKATSQIAPLHQFWFLFYVI